MDHHHDQNQETKTSLEPVRSRWTPKPEQIRILENIFNSGTVNPAKDETIKIRKILEQYGPLGDANVFYWFQNRRSRSRRRQRQLQAAAVSAAAGSENFHGHNITRPTLYETTPCSLTSSNSSGGGLLSYNYSSSSGTSSSSSSSSSSQGFIGDDSYRDNLFSICGQMGYTHHDHSPCMYSFDASQSQYQSAGNMTVFINGIPSEVPKGPFDIRAIFGQDVVLVHSSGELPPINEYGMLLQSLQMGESYILVSRPT